jgi:hypothetical protein
MCPQVQQVPIERDVIHDVFLIQKAVVEQKHESVDGKILISNYLHMLIDYGELF